VKIQITKTKSIDWTPPWEANAASVNDIVGIELNSGHDEGCPAVRLRRHKGKIGVVAVGFIKAPELVLPQGWDDLRKQTRLNVPAPFRAANAAFSINSHEASTRQAAAESLLLQDGEGAENVAQSKDGVRSVFRRMADQNSVLQASMPEYQVLWMSRLIPESKKPRVISIQTSPCALLASIAAQPHFCEENDEMAIFVTETTITLACFRKGIPLLLRDCPVVEGVQAMREAVKMTLGLDDTMLETVFSNNSIIDPRPALEPLLASVVSQIDLTLDYVKSRLNSEPKRLFLMGNAIGCSIFQRIIGSRLSLPLVSPSPFDGLELPARGSEWKNRYCIGDASSQFILALGAALAVMEEAK